MRSLGLRERLESMNQEARTLARNFSSSHTPHSKHARTLPTSLFGRLSTPHDLDGRPATRMRGENNVRAWLIFSVVGIAAPGRRFLFLPEKNDARETCSQYCKHKYTVACLRTSYSHTNVREPSSPSRKSLLNTTDTQRGAWAPGEK